MSMGGLSDPDQMPRANRGTTTQASELVPCQHWGPFGQAAAPRTRHLDWKQHTS